MYTFKRCFSTKFRINSKFIFVFNFSTYFLARKVVRMTPRRILLESGRLPMALRAQCKRKQAIIIYRIIMSDDRATFSILLFFCFLLSKFDIQFFKGSKFFYKLFTRWKEGSIGPEGCEMPKASYNYDHVIAVGDGSALGNLAIGSTTAGGPRNCGLVYKIQCQPTTGNRPTTDANALLPAINAIVISNCNPGDRNCGVEDLKHDLQFLKTSTPK